MLSVACLLLTGPNNCSCTMLFTLRMHSQKFLLMANSRSERTAGHSSYVGTVCYCTGLSAGCHQVVVTQRASSLLHTSTYIYTRTSHFSCFIAQWRERSTSNDVRYLFNDGINHTLFLSVYYIDTVVKQAAVNA